MSEVTSHQYLKLISDRIIVAARVLLEDKLHYIEYKSTNDAVTSFDKDLQHICFDAIRAAESKAVCISEELLTEINSEEFWIIDPLDGTSNFIQGVEPYAIAIAKIVNGAVYAALVIDLSNFDVYTAIKSNGAQLNYLPIAPKKTYINLLGVSTGFIKRNHLNLEGWNYRILGSQALHLCKVATGALSANISFEAKAWDDVAGSLIVSESGGYYCHNYPDETWLELALNQKSLGSIACSPSITADKKLQIMELIKDE